MAPTTTPLKATTTVVAPPPTTTKPVATCISSFKQSYPSTCVGHSLSTGPQPWSFVYATIGFVSGTFTNQRSWCVNYNHDAFSEQSYSQSTVYTYDHVVASPQFAPDIDQPDRLNQVAFLMNNIDVGSTVASPSSQKWWGKVYMGCSTITTNDFQAAVWALLHQTGECDNCYSGGLCVKNLYSANMCNVAYLWNYAFSNVTAGTPYRPPTDNCGRPVIYPLVVVPQAGGDSLLVAADINSWGVFLQCTACHGAGSPIVLTHITQ